MKQKLPALLLALTIACLLSGCGPAGEETPGEVSAAEDGAEDVNYTPIRTEEPDEEDIETLLEQGFQLVPEPEPYNPTEAELIEALFADNAFYDEPPSNFSPNLTEMAEMKGETVPFSTEPWEDQGVVIHDLTENMSPEDKAAWQEMKDMDEAELQAMQAEYDEAMAGFEDMGELVQLEDGTWTVEGVEDMPSEDDLQQQMDEALKEAQKELEGVELPEGYEDLLGGMDLSGLLGGS